MSELTTISNQLADAVQAAGAWTVRVQARRGPPASGIALASDQILTADHVVDPAREDSIRIGLPDGSEPRPIRVRAPSRSSWAGQGESQTPVWG